MADCDYLRREHRRAVVRKLGRPGEQDEFGVSYEIGPEPGPFSIDSEFLTFVVDGRGRVTGVELDSW